MRYSEQLKQNEWKEKRKVILERDNNKCRSCNRDRNEMISIYPKAKLKSSKDLLKEGFSIILSSDK